MIAFLGLGRMGARMAARLASTGHEVTVWNRTPSRTAVPGAQVAPTTAAAVGGAEIVITMLSDATAVNNVLFGEYGAASAMRPKSLLIEMSTIGTHAVADIRRRLPPSVGLVDAPVLGSLEPAASGNLLVLAGGSDADLARCQKVLDVFGEVRPTGPLGSGAAMKLAVMGVVVPLRVLLAEVLRAADANGVDPVALLDILASRGLGSFTGQTVPAKETRYALAHASKDLGLAHEAFGQASVDLGLLAAARTRLVDAERAGLGDRDLSAIYGDDMPAGRRRIEKINPSAVPPPAGAYSHAVRAGDLLFVSGQAALDARGDVVGEGDIEAQSEFVFDCLERILADQGATFDDVVSIRTFLTDMTTLSAYGAVRVRRMTGKPPSSTTVEVSKLFRPGLLLEVDVVAVIPD